MHCGKLEMKTLLEFCPETGKGNVGVSRVLVGFWRRVEEASGDVFPILFPFLMVVNHLEVFGCFGHLHFSRVLSLI